MKRQAGLSRIIPISRATDGADLQLKLPKCKCVVASEIDDK
jgi:hypothetical protein